MRYNGGYGFNTSSSIDKKIQENCDLESLLDDEDVIQEMKVQNKNLLN